MLKDRTVEIYQSIAKLWAQTGLPPSLDEIGADCFISAAALGPHLDFLQAGGYIDRKPRKTRSIRILKPLEKIYDNHTDRK